MRFEPIVTFALLLSTCSSQISRQECVDQGGVIVGDIGDGAIFAPGYVCDTDGLPPTDTVVAGPGEPIAFEGEVCCGGNGTGFVADTGELLPPDAGDGNNETDSSIFDGNGTRPEMSVDECAEQGGVLTYDIGDGAIHREDYLCELTGQPPIGTVIARSGESMPREGQVCCPSSGNEGTDGQPLPEPAERDQYTRQECTDVNGLIVGDIGNGAIFEVDYLCDSSGLPPIANIVQDEEPFAIEGEVCCEQSLLVMEVERDEVSRQECEEQGGEVVGDIGDGATQSADYICESNGEAPIANVVPVEGEPIASEGEVCCGPPAADTEPAGDGALSPSLRTVLGFVVGLLLKHFL